MRVNNKFTLLNEAITLLVNLSDIANAAAVSRNRPLLARVQRVQDRANRRFSRRYVAASAARETIAEVSRG